MNALSDRDWEYLESPAAMRLAAGELGARVAKACGVPLNSVRVALQEWNGDSQLKLRPIVVAIDAPTDIALPLEQLHGEWFTFTRKDRTA